MKKRSLIILFFLVFLLVLPVIVTANVEKVSKNLRSLNENQEMRVVVQLKEDSTERKGFSVEKKEIPEEKIKYKSGKNVFAILTKEEIEKLALSNSVEFISEEKKYHTFLQESVPLINATASWKLQSLGLNLTGQGQTICIIDTGVNYSHPDLGNGCWGNNDNTSDCKVIGGWNTYTNTDDIMDDLGHGTHVAGIVGANGGLNGTAPFSKIIMIKANVPGTNGFNGADIIEGIDWCVNNASKFNISVISMSLGGDSYYNSYCDSYPIEHSDRDAINRAAAKNISVVVASGNEYNKTSISSPACIQNVTPITSSNKEDTNISSFANVWNNVNLKILTAPGENIYSTYFQKAPFNGYASANGTSMATPHVAGAIAIINQYLKSVGQTKTPDQIENLLNSTGKQIYDSAAERNFSRINVYSALMEIDSTEPEVNLIAPIDNTVNHSVNQTFTCNATDWQLKNITLYVWNSSNELIAISSTNISGTVNTSSFSVTNMQTGTYKWNCLVIDEKGNEAFAVENFTIIIGGISLTLESPQNETYTNVNETFFNCSAVTSSDRQIKNMTFYVYENETLVNFTSVNLTGNFNSSLFNYTFFNESNYTWGCEIYSNDSDYDFKNYSITYDITMPNISIDSGTFTTNQATLNWHTSEETNYSITLQNISNQSFSLNHSVIIMGLSASTTYNYNLTYCDKAGNCNLTEQSFRTSDAPIIKSSGGGGGGGATQTKITEAQLSQGYSKKYNIGERVSFVSRGQNHSLQLNKIINNSVNITFRSEPVNLIIQNGEEKKINLTSAEYYDLYIKIENVTKYNANITLRSIEELINPYKIIKYDNETNETDKGKKYETFVENEETIERNLLLLYATLIILICTFFYFLLKNKLANKNKKRKKKKSKFL